MKNVSSQSIPKLLLVLSLASLSSSCGSGSDPENLDVPITDSETAVIDLAKRSISGVVVVEERNGKTVFDAWFTQSSSSEVAAGPADSTISQDRCQVSSVGSGAAQNSPVALGAALADTEFTSVGNSLSIESRLGEFESLVKQEVGDATVYATSERWQSASLPDDAELHFDSESVLGHMGSITVPPIMPLVWLTPESGVMASAASSLQWEPSFNEYVKIKLRLSAIDFSDSENPEVVTVSCDLIDDGLYTLPAEYQQQLPDDDMGISVYAVREKVQQVSGENSNLTVVQLSYPAPIKP